jgi:hypothetical protein
MACSLLSYQTVLVRDAQGYDLSCITCATNTEHRNENCMT